MTLKKKSHWKEKVISFVPEEAGEGGGRL